MYEIAKRIKELRTDADLNQATVAKLLGTSQSYYSEYELAKRQIPVTHIRTLCEFYGVTADYVLGLNKGLKWPR